MASDYRKYKAYYDARSDSAEGEKKHAERVQARRVLIREGRLKPKGDPREEDHKIALAKGGSGKMSNVRVTTRLANRKKYDH